jgi:hypothetical protein
MVEDYSPIKDKKTRLRIRKDVATHRIENGEFAKEASEAMKNGKI